MLFNSFSFLVFFPVVTVLYYLFPHRFRWFLLLIASCFFYISFIPWYILILLFLITVDFIAGLLIEKSKEKRRKIFLVISIFSNIGTLFIFKYFNFFNENIANLAHFFHWNYSISALQLILPIGLSFHVFQSLSYVIEVYRKKQKAEKHFGIYALYVMFYPQLVAGPIERPQQLLPQFHQEHKFIEDNVSRGLYRMAIGFFKKIVIADRLALLVNLVYGNPHEYIGIPLILATIGFAFQIYCDFSGYTDIAIGAAQVMGIKLVENFNSPYLAKSIQDFWRRWHMSLYNWFRDYAYIPLGGNRVNRYHHYLNILIVFLITGLWHGANWTFVVWGLIHGIYLVANNMLSRLKLKITFVADWLKTLFTFFLVCIAWIFFRANSLSDAFYILTNFFKGIGSYITSILKQDFFSANVYFFKQGSGIGLDGGQLLIALSALILLGFLEFLVRKDTIFKLLTFLKWGILIIIVLSIINFGTNYLMPFIYFQF